MSRGLYENGTPALLLEILQLDAGWLTKDGLMLDLPEPRNELTVERALFRLRERGLVQTRLRPLNPGDRLGLDMSEWKAA